MKMTSFRVRKYRSIIDSGWVTVSELTAIVGKNESGKTSLLKALHKFNPSNPCPFEIDREWPRGDRASRSNQQIVCEVEFALSTHETEALNRITGVDDNCTCVRVARHYSGTLSAAFPDAELSNELAPGDLETILNDFPEIPSELARSFRTVADRCLKEAKHSARTNTTVSLSELASEQELALQESRSASESKQTVENAYIQAYIEKLRLIERLLREAPSIQRKAQEYVVSRLPTIVYMDEYRVFRGSACLDDVRDRMTSRDKRLTEDDETLLTLLSLSGLDLDELVRIGSLEDREERQYDLVDASETLTRRISDHWGQSEYEVVFAADGQQFFTFVKSRHDRSLIRLDERSRGFQWFFSFDLLFMHQTSGTFRDCILLLDEPGLHLHPEGQQDLLKRLEHYAKGNTLIYTTHLPFMLDLQKPERIRVLSETKDEGIIVTEDLTSTQAEGKLTLQAALGIGGRTSFLVSERNLVVEGVDDDWILTALSALASKSGQEGLPDDLMVTPAGGASEVTYIATFMVGQDLSVVALYDSDSAGDAAKERLVKRWLARYKNRSAVAVSLGEACGTEGKFSIEDLFPDEYYLEVVREIYEAQLIQAGIRGITLPHPGGQLVKRVKTCLSAAGIQFNKGSVAKRICSRIRGLDQFDELPRYTAELARRLLDAIVRAADQDLGN